MSLWICTACHTLTSLTQSMRCECGGTLVWAQMTSPTSGTTTYGLSYDDRRLSDAPCPDCKRVIQHGRCKDPVTCRYRLLGQSEPKGAWSGVRAQPDTHEGAE